MGSIQILLISIVFLYKYALSLPFYDFIQQQDPPRHNNNFELPIFDPTRESFFDYARRRTAELKSKNKDLFEKAVNLCPYSIRSDEINEENTAKRFPRSFYNLEKKMCIVGSYNFENNYGLTSDRLFLFDPYTIGLISSSDSSLRLYNFNLYHKSLNQIRIKYFRNEVPTDACADKNKNIYVVFPDQNKIAKYTVNQSFTSRYSSRQNKTQTIIREVASDRDFEFRPSAISCNDDHIYVSENPKNQIRIYDKFLKLVRIIYLNGVIVSNHRGLAINQNVRVLMDGSDSLALFNPSLSSSNSNNKKYSLSAEKNRVTVCHFYKNMECLEDVHVAIESKSKSFIYTADSCNNEIKQFLYIKDEKISLVNRFAISGRPISVVTNQLGYIFVLTDLPRKIYILDPREC
ncbi:unnamed protein product [Brachionus calyciflorus]|uniref:Uncharacterized protein n=1 Tax=Brachionus calyciflorus TaxID=104777 RepID=A0A814DK68_9BILA|nr:unnamed protein product [Brachionus calyciflorus]